MISYIIWSVDPEIFEGYTFLRWYGLCWVFGIFAGQQVMRNIYKVEQQPATDLDRLTIYLMLGAIVGARSGHILFYDPIHYLNNPIEILPVKINPEFQFTGLAGLASHGGVVGALFALYLYDRKRKSSYLWYLDRLVIAGALLGSFIRLGNLLNSEIIGSPTNVSWAFVFTQVDDIPRHPSQLYEATFYLFIGILLYLFWRSGKFKSAQGFIFGLGFTLIFLQRFLIEFLKENQAPFEQSLTLNMGQLLSIPLILGGIGLMIWSIKRPRPQAQVQ